MYLVTVTTEVQPNYQCNCEAFYHFTECSHVVAAMTLEKVFSLNDKISSISRAKLRGRPRKYTPVGFATDTKSSDSTSEGQACCFFGGISAKHSDSSSRSEVANIDTLSAVLFQLSCCDGSSLSRFCCRKPETEVIRYKLC